jgi:hypothetical protein
VAAGAGVTFTSWPMSEASIRRTPRTVAPAPMATRPMSSVPASTVPSCLPARPSSTMRLTSSMSATLPVSFQYPEITVDFTL